MKEGNIGDVIIICLLFLINPLVGILVASIMACKNKRDSSIKVLMVLCTFYLCALNTTKVPESDMIRYLQMYEFVPFLGFKGMLQWWGASKDVAYTVIVFLLYYITLGNRYLFIFIVSFMVYWLMFMAIFKFCKEYQLPVYIIVAEVLVLSFFVQYFSLTFHLVRQILATSVFLYALTFKNTSFWKYLLLSVLAMGIHSAIGILVVLSLVPFMKRKLTLLEISVLIMFAFASVVIISTFASFVLDTVAVRGSMRGTLSRAANMEGAYDNTVGVQLIGLAFSVLTIILCLIERGKGKEMVYPMVVNISLVTAFMILGLTISPLIQYRFFFFLYSFFPLLLPILFREKVLLSKIICGSATVMLTILFYARLNHVFEYVPVVEAVFYPYPLLIKLV